MVHNLDMSSLVWAPATLAEFFCGILAACWATIVWGGASACQPWIPTLFQALKICIKFSEKLSNWFCNLIIFVLYIFFFFRKNGCCLYLMELLCCKIQLSIKAYIWFFVVLMPRHWYLGRESLLENNGWPGGKHFFCLLSSYCSFCKTPFFTAKLWNLRVITTLCEQSFMPFVSTV